MINPENLLDFWFGDLQDDGFSAEPQNKLWFGFDPKIDRQIAARFEPELERAVTGAYQDWESNAKGRLALIILLDQLPRNIYRGTAKAFAYDNLALQHCLDGIDAGQDKTLAPVQRAFFYMPLEHSEAIEHQDLSVQKMQDMQKELPPTASEKLAGFAHYAEIHRDIIIQFSRFPHRNRLLGRKSSAAEVEYLDAEDTGFGQG